MLRMHQAAQLAIRLRLKAMQARTSGSSSDPVFPYVSYVKQQPAANSSPLVLAKPLLLCSPHCTRFQWCAEAGVSGREDEPPLVLVDLKGVLFRAVILPLAGTVFVVNMGPTEAKVGTQA